MKGQKCVPLYLVLCFFFKPLFNIVIVTMQLKSYRKEVWVSYRGVMDKEGGQSQDLSDLLSLLEVAWPGPC